MGFRFEKEAAARLLKRTGDGLRGVSAARPIAAAKSVHVAPLSVEVAILNGAELSRPPPKNQILFPSRHSKPALVVVIFRFEKTISGKSHSSEL